MTTRGNCAILNIRRVLPVDGVPRGVYKEVTVSLGGLAVTSLLLSFILFEQGNNRNYEHTECKKLHPCNHSVSPPFLPGVTKKLHPQSEGKHRLPWRGSTTDRITHLFSKVNSQAGSRRNGSSRLFPSVAGAGIRTEGFRRLLVLPLGVQNPRLQSPFPS